MRDWTGMGLGESTGACLCLSVPLPLSTFNSLRSPVHSFIARDNALAKVA